MRLSFITEHCEGLESLLMMVPLKFMTLYMGINHGILFIELKGLYIELLLSSRK